VKKSGVKESDLLLKQGDVLQFGSKSLKVFETPGHTNTCLTYVLDDNSLALTGDALFVRGCGRTDFQEGSSEQLWNSIHNKVFTLPDQCLLYPGHDYKGHTVTSVAEEKEHNPRLGGKNTLQTFTDIMQGLKLANPAKIHIAVPANLRCGLSEENKK